MQLEHELLKEQRFFRNELIDRIYWFIQLRWVAAVAAIAGSWGAYLLWDKFPVLPLNAIVFFIILYNIIFHLIWKHLKFSTPHEIKPFATFIHLQISLDIFALYLLVYFTGGVYSPFLIFLLFHIILSGILLSPVSCFLYGITVVVALGSLMILEKLTVLPYQPVLFESALFPYSLEFPGILIIYITFGVAVFITAFLVTSIKLSLITKSSELLRVSKEMHASNAKLTALYEMIKNMGVCSDIQDLMDSATRNAARIMGVKGCSIKLLDEQRKMLRFASTYGLSEDYVAKGSIDIEKSSINREIIQGSFYSIGKIDEKDYFEYPENIRKEGIASMVCLPLRVEKMVIGVFCVYSDVSYYFVDSDIKFFSLMSDLTALAIESLKSELSKTWFLKKAAHQLRSPSNAIYSMLKTIRKGYLGPVTQEQEKTIERCEKRIEILGQVINDLLELSIKQADITKTIIHPVDSTKIIKALINLYQTRALEKGIEITFHIEDSLPQIMADERLIDDLFINLISNAIKYTRPGGKVQVSLVKESQNHVRFEVSDTGIGIHEEDIPRLFSEFFRTENAKEYVEEGSGLGLVIVKGILDRLKGTISVKSKSGEGTRFTCLLPSV